MSAAARQADVETELPAATESARGVLGALILSAANGDAACRTTAFACLECDDFADPDFGVIFDAMKAMHAEGVALEPRLVNARVRDRVENSAAIIYEAPSWAITTATISYYCQLVKEASRERQLQLALNDAANLRTKNTTEAISTLRAKLDAILPAETPATLDAFEAWEASVIHREQPKLFDHAAYGSRLKEFQLGEGLVTLIGAPPGAGKTALTGQIVVDALQHPDQPDLRALIANVEMGPSALLNRWLARLTGVGYQWIQHRDYDDDATDRIKAGIEELRALMPRLRFMGPPFFCERVDGAAAAFHAQIVVLDYAQRLDSEQRSSDMRAQANVVMDFARRIADQGRAVIVVSAVNRHGYTKEGAGLASFRESSELEYGADSAWLMVTNEQDRGKVTLKCVKNRFGQLVDVSLLFDGSRMSFTDDKADLEWNR